MAALAAALLAPAGRADTSARGHPLSRGPGYEIYKPFAAQTSPSLHSGMQLMAAPEMWIRRYARKVDNLKSLMDFEVNSSESKARDLYLEMMLNLVSGLVFGTADVAATPVLGTTRVVGGAVARDKASAGLVWPGFGVTMVGERRLRNIHALLREVFVSGVPGHYIETGVWRGGASIFARAVMRAYGQRSRWLLVCDSFKGLPPSTLPEDAKYGSWDNTKYTEVTDAVVADNFIAHGVFDEGVVFVKGFFNDSLPAVRELVRRIAVIRFDGDMYEAAADMLYLLYDRLELGGFVIMDDWTGFPSKDACIDFFSVHGLAPDVVPIDALSAYWRKTSHVRVQRWRHERKTFRGNATATQ